MPVPEPMSRWRSWVNRLLRPALWSLSARSAAAAALVVAASLAATSCGLLWMLHHSMVGAADAAAAGRGTDIANQLVNDSPADLDNALFATDSRIAAVQVLSPDGRVLRTSSSAWSSPLTSAHPRLGQVIHGAPPAGRDAADLRLVARTVGNTGSGRLIITVGANQHDAESTLDTVALMLAGGCPLIVLVAAAATWALVRRSLASVERIREQVAAIGAGELDGRVPVPDTGDEIARLATTMNAMLARIAAGHRTQRRFVGDASHELRSPLATLSAAMELAHDRPATLDRSLLDDILLPETRRMRELVDDLLTLARADETGIALRVDDVDLDDLVANEAERLRTTTDLAVQTALSPIRLRGDRERLARMMRNLGDNAALHGATEVAMTISIDDHGRRPEAVVTIDDDGPGIPASDRTRVFERFVRLDEDRSRTSGGTGLGLAIVSEIVTAHGGSITAAESPSKGARFIIRLPTPPSKHLPMT